MSCGDIGKMNRLRKKLSGKAAPGPRSALTGCGRSAEPDSCFLEVAGGWCGGFAAYKEANGNTNYGLPIFILIDKLGKARFAEPDETRELMRRWNSDEEEDED